jgi:hypothetical protein
MIANFIPKTHLMLTLVVLLLFVTAYHFLINQKTVIALMKDAATVKVSHDDVPSSSGDTGTTKDTSSNTLIPYQQPLLLLDRWIANAPNLAIDLSLKSSSLPSRKKPFVFFHIRKAAGSSLRTIIHKASEIHGFDSWIPCHGNWSCVPFSLPPPSEPKAVYAGHVNYGLMAQLRREAGPKLVNATTTQTFRDDNNRSVTYYSLDDDRKEPFRSCVINIRPTVNRVESCWNYRFTLKNRETKGLNIPKSYNTTAEEWNTLLPDAVDFFGNGCNNEYARILGNTLDESLVNRISPETYGQEHYVNELETILSRMSRCVMILAERCEESNIILKHYLPWITEANLCSVHEKQSEKKKELEDEAKEAILSQNHFDEMIFSFGAKLFEAQLAESKRFV